MVVNNSSSKQLINWNTTVITAIAMAKVEAKTKNSLRAKFGSQKLSLFYALMHGVSNQNGTDNAAEKKNTPRIVDNHNSRRRRNFFIRNTTLTEANSMGISHQLLNELDFWMKMFGILLLFVCKLRTFRWLSYNSVNTMLDGLVRTFFFIISTTKMYGILFYKLKKVKYRTTSISIQHWCDFGNCDW